MHAASEREKENMRTRWAGIVGLVLVAATAHAQTALTPEALVAQHLEALGDPEARAAAKSRGVDGKATFLIALGGIGHNDGVAKMASDAGKFRLSLRFGGERYPGEDIISDGKRVSVATIAPGKRSQLGFFLYTRSEVLKEGLFGGALSTAWPLLDLAAHHPRVRYLGLKNIEGRELHDLRYEPHKGEGDLQIDLYFEPETYRHVRTTYVFTMPPDMASNADASGRAFSGESKLVETFSEFHTVNGLTLPAQWNLELSWGGGGTWVHRWSITADRVVSLPIDPAAFDMH